MKTLKDKKNTYTKNKANGIGHTISKFHTAFTHFLNS